MKRKNVEEACVNNQRAKKIALVKIGGIFKDCFNYYKDAWKKQKVHLHIQNTRLLAAQKNRCLLFTTAHIKLNLFRIAFLQLIKSQMIKISFQIVPKFKKTMFNKCDLMKSSS